MKKRICTAALMVALAATALSIAVGAGLSDPQAVIERQLQVGQSEIIECTDAVRAAVGDPLIADVVPVSTSEILINAKSPGTTVVYVWDASGRRVYKVIVQPVELDLAKLCEAIQKKLDDPRIAVRGVGNTIILEGTVSSATESGRMEAIAQAVVEMSAFQGTSPGGSGQEIKTVSRPEGDSFVLERVVEQKSADVSARVGLRLPKIVNLIQVEKPYDEVSARTMETASAIRQALNNPALTVRALPGSVVLVEGKVGTDTELTQVNQLLKGWEKSGSDGKGAGPGGELVEKVTMVNAVEIDSSVARQVMVRAQVVDIDRRALKDFGVDWGRVVFEESDIPGVDATATVQDQPWLFGQAQTGPFDIFDGGKIFRFDPVGARVRALEQQNKAKVLSEPNLLVLDGREASMLVGGEIPIPIVQGGTTGAGTSVTVTYKEFGVRLKILPSITSEDTLQLKVMPEVSALDFANAIVLNGFQIPALRSRRAETTVNIRNGQSLIIGGLVQNETAKLVKQIPLLGDLPIIGELFKTRSFVKGESELVIIVTPQIVQPTATAQAEG